jgi:transcriptional regulator with XRE-family HTH domain
VDYGELISHLQGEFVSQEEAFWEVGERIKSLRGAMSQVDFAARLNVDRKSVAGWEAGKRLPDGSSLLKLMDEFGADVNYLLAGERARGSKTGPALTAEEETMLGYFREASKEVRRAALGALLGAASKPAAGSTGIVKGGFFSSAIGRINVKK